MKLEGGTARNHSFTPCEQQRCRSVSHARTQKVLPEGDPTLTMYFFFVTEERIQKALKTDHHRPASEKPLLRERSGSVVECLTQDRRAAGSSLTGVTVFLSKNINPSLVLVQPRKTRPYITERLLMERKESNQTNTHLNSSVYVFHIDFRR